MQLIRLLRNAKKRRLGLFAGLLPALFLVFTGVCWSQTTQQFTGHVQDSSGAVIPSAQVVIRNQATGVTSRTQTTSVGAYSVPYLTPGIYNITVSKNGFKTVTKTDISLNVDQTSTINFTLTVGAQTEQVTVNASASQINVTNPDRGQIITGHLTEQMPLDGRNPYTLFSLAPGTRDFSSAQYPRPFDNVTGNQYVNGSPQVSQTNIDGIGNDASDAGRTAFTPSVDVISQFKIVTNAYDASYGLSGGSAIDVQLKSGTNKFHGSLDWFGRRTWLDAYDWQTKYNNPLNPQKAQHKRDQWGVEGDGPLIIPHVFNGRNKLFYTVSYEQMKDILPNPSYNVYSLPNPAWLAGNFSGATYWNTATNSLQPLTIYDPLTPLHPVYDPNDGQTKMAHSAFPGNIIPSDRIDLVAKKLASYYGDLKPNVNPGPGFAPWSNNYENLQVENDLWRNAMIKVDWNLDQSNKFSFRWAGQGRWIHSNWNVGAPNSDPANNNGHGAAPKTQTGAVQWTHIFSPSLLLNVGADVMTYANQQNEGTVQAQNFISTLGFSSSYASQVQNTNIFPNINATGLPGAQSFAMLGPSWLGYSGDRHALDLLPTLTYVHGAHTLRAGINIDFFQWLSPSGGNADSFNFNTNFTGEFGPGSTDAPGYSSGLSIASLLLGYPDTGTVWWNLHPFYSQHYFAPWAQDDWKVTKNLTLNLGLRWDFLTPEVERQNAMTGAFDPTILNPVSSGIPAGTAALGENTNLQGGLTFAGVNGQPRGAYKMNMLEIQPRLGFAYAISNNMSIRGGIGQNYMNDQTINNSDGFSSSTSYTNSLDGGITPYTATTGKGLSDPIPVVRKPTGSSLGYLEDLGSNITYTNPHYRRPSFWQYSLTYEIAPTRGDVISVSYVGNRVPDQPESSNINIGSPQWNAHCDVERGGNRKFCDDPTYGDIANPFQGVAGFEGSSYYSASVISKYNFTRPYPEFGDITETGATNNGKSWYNSFQAQWTHRLSHGLMVNASYTHARAMTSGAWIDQVNHVRARQVSGTNDINNAITFAAVGTLPFGQGRLLFSNVNRWVNALINGWQISPLYTYYSGAAWFPKDSGGSGGMYDYAGNWETASGAPITKSMATHRTVLPTDGQHGFRRLRGVTPCVGYKDTDTGRTIPSPAAVAAGCSSIEFVRAPNAYAVGRNNETFGVRQPGAYRFDASASKNFKIPGASRLYLSDDTNLQLRVDVFNVFNHPNWDESYNSDPTSIDFGTIAEGPNGPTNLPRYLQLSARLSW